MSNSVIQQLSELVTSDVLKCTICKNSLSVPPIVDVEDIGIVCGRCQNLIFYKKSNPKIERQSLYEKMAAIMKFPCMYQVLGCQQQLNWDDVLKHENSCPLRNIRCFLYSKKDLSEVCRWRGNVKDLIPHFKTVHHKYFFTQPRIALKEIVEKGFCRIFAEYSILDVLFLFAFDAESDSIFSMAVTEKNAKTAGIEYELKISSDEKTTLSLFKPIFDFSYIGADMKTYGSKIDMSLIRHLPKADFIEIFCRSKNHETTNELNDTDTKLDKVQQFDIKCIHCNNTVFSPVFDGPSCENCGTRRNLNVSDVFNFIVSFPKYACRNSKVGCRFIGSSSELKNHDEICSINNVTCCVCCWQGPKYTIDNHLRSSHKFPDLHGFHEFRIQNLLFIFDGEFLSLEVNSQSEWHKNGLIFSVASDGCNKSRYKYEIEIISESVIATKLSIQHIADTALFNIKRTARTITVPFELLNQMFPDIKSLKFKLNVSKLDM